MVERIAPLEPLIVNHNLRHVNLNLNILYQNVRGLRTKLVNLRCSFPLLLSYDVIILTETWLSPDIHSSELGFEGFRIFRLDRNSLNSPFSRGGGVLIAIKDKFKSSFANTHIVNVEQVFATLTYGSFTLLIGAIYLPPNTALPIIESHTTVLEELISSINPSSVLLCGDFNFPNVTWSNGNLGLCAHGNLSTSSACIADAFSFFNFFQLNNQPNSHGSLLDLVLSNSNKVTVTIATFPLVSPDSYHPPLAIVFPITSNIQPKIEHSYSDFKSGNYAAMSQFLGSFDWASTFSLYTINDAAEVFNDALLSAINKFIPIKSFISPKFPRWVSKELKRLIFAKKKAHMVYKRSHSSLDYNIFSQLRAQCKKRSIADHTNFVKESEKLLSSSPTYFWRYINNLSKKLAIPNSVHLDNINSNLTSSSADLFNTYFSSTFNPPIILPSHSPSPFQLPYDLPSNIYFSPYDVLSALNSLKSNFSNGPDNISAICLYNCRHVVAYPLYLLFKRSLSDGVFPSVWKISAITPVHKTGDTSNVKNYRPISIIPHIAKLFESLVYSKIKRSLNHIIVDEQHGFRPGKSTTTSSVIFTSYLTDAIENRGQVDVILTDFKKAFDTVDHGLLIRELKALGVGDPLLTWIASYLTDRKQYVKLHGSVSKITNITSGVPQGGHLSPLLFILFVNSISKWITKAKFLLFADDIKIYMKIDNHESCKTLQSQLNLFLSWVEHLGLMLNIDKCHIMTFTRQRNPISYPYSLNDIPLQRVSLFKDLGIYYTPSLNFDHHINATVSKALKVMGFIKRNTSMFKSAICLRTLYFSLVRSILEYGAIIWHPYLARDLIRLERVQNRFLSYAAYLLNIEHPQHDYSLIRSKLNIPLLSTRRSEADFNFISSVLNGSLDVPEILSDIKLRVPSHNTRIHNIFHIPPHSTSYGFNHPLHRMLRSLNDAPLHCFH